MALSPFLPPGTQAILVDLEDFNLETMGYSQEFNGKRMVKGSRACPQKLKEHIYQVVECLPNHKKLDIIGYHCCLLFPLFSEASVLSSCLA